jgi:TetR/AcrR family transcriptional regulator
MRHPNTKSAPGRPTVASDRNAREALLAAAAELFGEHGVGATTLAMIAKRAALTPAMVHYYFRNKEQLLDAIVAERIGASIDFVWGPVEPGTDPSEILSGIVARILDVIERMPWIPSVWVREVLNDRGILRGRILPLLPRRKIRAMQRGIARGQGAGRVNADLDPALIGFSMIGLVMLHMAAGRFWAQTFRRKVPTAEHIRGHVTALLLHGLTGTSQASPLK